MVLNLTPLLVLKGFVEITDPAVMIAKAIIDIANSIAFAPVAAIKSGAIDYLPKPAEIDQIYDALTNSKEILPPPPENPMTADRIRWEHIQRVFIQCNRNVSETARRLRMHRRTLQRILNKHAPRE